MDVLAPSGKDHCEEYQEIQILGNDLPVLRIKTKTGWKTLDSLHNPEGEYKQLTDGKLSNEIILLGCGSGFLLRAVLQRNPRHLFIITGFCIVYSRIRKLLQDIRNISFEIALRCETFPSDKLFSELRSFLERFPNASVIVHPGESKAHPKLFNPLLAYIECLQQNMKKRKSFQIRRILFPQKGMLLEPDLIEEFCRRGYEIIIMNSFAHKRISCKDAAEMLKVHAPDMVFSINNRGSDRNGFIPEMCQYGNILWATWFLDNPAFLVSEYEHRAGQHRTAFCWDTSGIETCKELDFDHIALLPLGVNQRRFTPGCGKEELKGRLVYVGSPSFGNEERYFSSLKQKPFAYRIADLFLNSVMESRIIPSVDEVCDALRHEKIPHGYFTESEIKRIPAFVLYAANLIYRVKALKAISDLSPIVYGDGWHGLLPDQITILPYIDYYRDLAEIYRSDAVHLSLTHLQMRYYPNQRIFDAGACARPVIGEWLPGCKELFGDCFDELFFKSHEELHEKAVALLENRHRRKELGEWLHTIVLKKHTLSVRMSSVVYSFSGKKYSISFSSGVRPPMPLWGRTPL